MQNRAYKKMRLAEKLRDLCKKKFDNPSSRIILI